MIRGQDQVITALENLLESERFPHGLLLSGPEGVGKRMLALLLAETLLTPKNLRSPLPTLNAQSIETRKKLCEDSALVISGSHPDLFYLGKLEDKRDIAVEGVRELIGQLSLKSYRGGAKVALIDDAHRLSNAGANALLMTLEEPPPNTYLILCSHAEHRLPATILSRLQKLSCGSLTDATVGEIIGNLTGRGASSNAGDTSANGPNISEILDLCDGSLGPLEIDRFRNPLTSTLTEPEELEEHLQQISTQLRAWEGALKSLESHQGAAEAMRLASLVTKSDVGTPLFLGFVRNRLRRQMRQSQNPAQTRDLASQLLATIDTERGILERNLNAELQLSRLLYGQAL